MSIYLVRHAKAGNRGEWIGDDSLRPLTKPGWRQAQALATRLSALGVSQLLTSPYIRCRQTLEPLAAATDLPIADDDRLIEGSAFAPVIDLIVSLPDGAVLCSHGDVIPDTIGALERRGCRFNGTPDWRKASVWVLDRDGEQITHAEAWPPPE